jgi:hypothetical protein
LIKWDGNGNQIWNRTWGNGSADGNGIWGDGTNIYTVGNLNSSLSLIKWDSSGNQLWNRTWSNGSTDGNGIWGDGTNIYTCGLDSPPNFIINGYNYCLFLIKWDLAGDQIWNMTWGNDGQTWGNQVWGDGTNLYVSGHTLFRNTDWGQCLIKCDENGNVLWNKTIGSDSFRYDYGGIWGEGNNIFTSFTTTSSSLNDNQQIIKWDANGNQLWNSQWNNGFGAGIWGNNTNLYAIINTNEGLSLFKGDFNGNGFSSPSIVGEYILIISGAGLVCFIIVVIAEHIKRKK